MIADLTRNRAELAAVCRRFRVRRLDAFGSAARGADFDATRSDIDLLVEYEPDATPDLADYLALEAALAALFGHKVDLVMASAIRNPYLRARIEAGKVPLHGA